MERIHESGVETAKKIRKALKVAFPGVKFSVRSDYNTVNIHWADARTIEEVEEITNRFKSGSFNGMEDIYEYGKGYEYEGKLYSGAKYIFTSRELSDEYRAEIEAYATSKGYNMTRNNQYYHQYLNKAEKEMKAPTIQEAINEAIEVEEQTTEQNQSEETFEPATPKQLFALHMASNRTINTKEMNISKTKASELIGSSKSGEDITAELESILNGNEGQQEEKQNSLIGRKVFGNWGFGAGWEYGTIIGVETDEIGTDTIIKWEERDGQQRIDIKDIVIVDEYTNIDAVGIYLLQIEIDSQEHNCGVIPNNKTTPEQPKKNNVISFVDPKGQKEEQKKEEKEVQKQFNYFKNTILPNLTNEEITDIYTTKDREQLANKIQRYCLLVAARETIKKL